MATSWFSLTVAALVGLAVGCDRQQSIDTVPGVNQDRSEIAIDKAELDRIRQVVLQKQIESGEAIDVHKESKWVGPKFREISRWYGMGPKSVGSVRKDGSAMQIRWTVIGDRGELLVYRQTIPDQPWETFSSAGGVETHYLHAPAGHYLLQLNGEFQEWEIVVSIQSKES